MHVPDRGLYGRLGVTLLVLLAYRVGCHLPLPGLDTQKIGLLYEGGGTATARVSVLALGIMPLISALILLEFVKLAAPELRTWERAHRATSAATATWPSASRSSWRSCRAQASPRRWSR